MTDTTTTATAAALVAGARTRVSGLTPEEFAAESDTGVGVVVDLRETDERVRDGSIRGAVSIPRGMLEFRADPASTYHDDRLHPDRRVLLHCATGGRSALAADTLANLGYHDIAHLDGGIAAWTAAGFPVFGKVSAPY